MQKDINFLEKLADVECGCMDDENHDCDNCVYCESRRVLNDIGETAAYAVKSAQQRLHLTGGSLPDLQALSTPQHVSGLKADSVPPTSK